jgi:DNA adenine methylase
MSCKQITPVLRWAGSKRRLLSQLAHALPEGARYYEPFAGSACLYFATRPRRAVLGDLNSDLIGFYRTLRHSPHAVARRLHGWRVDSATYYRVRALDPLELGASERAARFLYLNRLCFNGVYRTDRSGRFNVPYGRRTGALPSTERLVRCASALRAAELRDGDFEATVADAMAGDTVYLDPPYTQRPERSYGVYGYGSFDVSELERMLRCLEDLDDRRVSFLFSYALLPGLIERVRPSWSVREVRTPSSVAAHTTARVVRHEILLSNAARIE